MTAFGRAMAERFDKDKPQSGEYRKQTIYRGIRLRAGDEETSENPGKNAVATSCHQLLGSSLENASSIGGYKQLGATRGNSKIVVCKCGSKATVSEQVRWFDCRECGHLQEVPA